MLVWAGDINNEFLRKLVRASEAASLILCSSGGNCEIMTGAIDLMSDRTWRVHTLGSCMSAAVPLVALGARGARTAAPNTRFMVHLGQLSMSRVDASVMELERIELERYERLYADVLGRCTKKRARWWKQLMSDGRPYYFGAEAALQMGLVDGIQ